MRKTTGIIFLTVILSGCCSHTCSTGGEQQTAQYFDSIRQQPARLQTFLREMPKGGDLHNHLAGAIYAESFIDYAAASGLCYDPKTESFVNCDKKPGQVPASEAYTDPALFHNMLDAFSMRDFHPHCDPAGPADSSATVCESNHDHFFDTFPRFGLASDGHTGEMLAEAAGRAAADHLQYLELMNTVDGKLARNLGTKTLGEKSDWENNFAAARDELLAAGMKTTVVPATLQQLDRDEARMREVLHCGASQPSEGCNVQVRYLYQVLRGQAPGQVFAQILLGFELAQADPRFVGLNLVQPEDWYVPMHDFELHMRMLDYLHGVYPNVHISLHAGELAPGLVPPDGLRFHIRDSVRLGHAERIGHGVDIVYEDGHEQVLKEMAEEHVLVEICLTSNDAILGVRGAQHPLKTYLDSKVPVALATDDEGVARSDMTTEYVRAVQTYDFLRYKDLKRMARMSLEHSFLPGTSLWGDAGRFRVVDACGNDAGHEKISPDCQRFLDSSDRARMQWKLESEFWKFEKKY
jgi:adenosine deaminase